jgi:hypothetical protein
MPTRPGSENHNELRIVVSVNCNSNAGASRTKIAVVPGVVTVRAVATATLASCTASCSGSGTAKMRTMPSLKVAANKPIRDSVEPVLLLLLLVLPPPPSISYQAQAIPRSNTACAPATRELDSAPTYHGLRACNKCRVGAPLDIKDATVLMTNAKCQSRCGAELARNNESDSVV